MRAIAHRLAVVAALLWAAAAPAEEATPTTSAPQSCMECHDTWSADRLSAFRKSIHGDLDCTGCHEGAGEYPHTTATVQPQACATCHEDPVKDYLAGSHAKASEKTEKAFKAACSTCHGETHKISKLDPAIKPEETCAKCHGDKGMASMLGLSRNVWTGWEGSIHGQKRTLGHIRSPGCADCHGSHKTVSLKVDSPATAAARLQSCTKCHPGAGENFALAFSHDAADPSKRPWANLVTLIYSILISFTVVALSGLILLELFSMVIRKLLGKKIPAHAHDTLERFSLEQRGQHFIVVVTFLLLVFTGIPLMAASADKETGLLQLFGGVEQAGRIHRIAGALMIGATLWHLFWLLRKKTENKLTTEMLPGLCDIKEFIQEVKMYMLLSDEPPHREGKYGWMEKFEYWAFGWGIAVMGFTGAILWFPVTAGKYLPDGGLHIVQLVHAFEALLATVSIFLWHFYQVHLKPGIFPMNWTWLTGKVK